jgi:Asp-tRNA(Asn)/Glu-tRNA(Gln) amidotransferase A subunit family amidase
MSCEESIRALLAQIDAREGEIGAWAWLDHRLAIRQAQALDAETTHASLHGMPIGVKDVIDTADMPTEYNSPIYSGHRPTRDAEVVRRLKSAGAIIMGKTVTTEFAFMAPGRTRNPHNTACTPGGSSSGSAAAVAASMVPVALTTQTGGSTIRPAAFCGVIGYKPAFGRYPTTGLKYLAPSLDTIGLHARDLNELARVSGVLAGDATTAPLSSVRPRLALTLTHHAGVAEPQAAMRLEAVAQALARAGAEVRVFELPALFAEIDPLHRVVMSSEVAQSFTQEWAHARERLSADLAKFIEQGLAYSAAQVADARALVAQGKRLLRELTMEGELVLTLPAAGEAPVGLGSTGNAAFNRLWTLLGLACITLPAGRGMRGLPLGVQLVGSDSSDVRSEQELLAMARWTQDAMAAAGFIG